jgi:hypothetical protein
MKFIDRIRNAVNVFMNNDSELNKVYNYTGYSSSIRPDRNRYTITNERSIIQAIYNKIAVDVSQLNFVHAKVNDDSEYVSDVEGSCLNRCFKNGFNIDQGSKEFIRDIVSSMLNDGCAVVVPVETDKRLNDETTAFEIYNMRVGKVIEWLPHHVRVDLYNEKTGQREQIIVPKSTCPIIYNPFYSIMNEPNSTYSRLNRKLNILDAVDEQAGSGKLDLIIQLPYVVKNETKKQQAEQRRTDIEKQLSGSKYGIAYTDGTERITQLNRPVENNLLKTVEYLTSMLFSQLGVNQSILDGSADDKMINNYRNNILAPIADAIADEFTRKFLTDTAVTQHQKVVYFTNPFKLIPISLLADTVDKLTRNEVMSPNDIRRKLGLRPSADPKADELRNRNISQATDNEPVLTPSADKTENPNE